MKIALVHDYLVQYGGAERVLEAFCGIWPEAPIFTLIYNPRSGKEFLKNRNIQTSFLQKIPFSRSRHRLFSLLMPLAIEGLNLSDFDVILSDSSGFAKGIITRPQTLHVSYCHTPLRYAWDDCHRYLDEFGWPGPIKFIAPALINYLRLWDQAAAKRPERILANSYFVRRRVKKYYNREAEVIYPPVEIDKFKPESAVCVGDYYLAVGRFLPYKKFDIAIEAFNKLKLSLKIIGFGPDLKRLKKMAGPTVEILDWVSDDKVLASYYQKARAFIFPQEEDFGISAVEAMAAGRPVIAFRAGGALEIVKEGKTGLFFNEQTPASLKEAVLKFQKINFDSQKIINWAKQFDKEIFKQKIKNFVEKSYEDFQKNFYHDHRR